MTLAKNPSSQTLPYARAPAGRLFELKASAREGVDPAPAPGDIEQRQQADALRQRGVDDEMIADRFKAEHRAHKQERRTRRPRLRAAGGRVLPRVLGAAALVAAEGLGQAPFEDLGGVEDAGGEDGGLLLEAVAAKAPGDERGIERPDSPHGVAGRVGAALALGQGAHAPAGEEPRPEQVAGDGLRFRLVDDAAPEQVAVVRAQGIELLPLVPQGKREVLAVLAPEVAVEAALEVARLPLQLIG